MAKSSYQTIVVKDSTKVTPNMQKVTFTGDGLADFPNNPEGGYVKLFFSKDGQAVDNKSQFRENEKPLSRTYTLRAFSRIKNELAIEFSLHRHKGGPASTWAGAAEPGDKILMAGPGRSKPIKNTADWFLLAGDMSGLPALCCKLEQLPHHAQGYAVIEIVSEDDQQALKVPSGIDVRWVINNKPGEKSDALLNTIKSLPWKAGNPYVWVACEFNSMKKIRHYLQDSREVKKDNMYTSSYWKFNRTEEQHRVDKGIDSISSSFLQLLCKGIPGWLKG